MNFLKLKNVFIVIFLIYLGSRKPLKNLEEGIQSRLYHVLKSSFTISFTESSPQYGLTHGLSSGQFTLLIASGPKGQEQTSKI